MIDDLLLHDLGKGLFFLEKYSSRLDDLIFPLHRSTEGMPTGRALGSRPPANLAMIDLITETQALLGYWCLEFSSASGIPIPGKKSTAIQAGFLQRYLGEFAQLEFAEIAAREIIAQAQLVEEVISDPAEPAHTPVEEGSCRVIASWASKLGVQVSKSTISAWARQGAISSRIGDDGVTVLVRLSEVLERCSRRSPNPYTSGQGLSKLTQDSI